MSGLRSKLTLIAVISVLSILALAMSAGAYNVSGTITFQDFTGSTIIPVTIDFWNVANGELSRQVINVSSSTGAYTATGVTSGTYDITYQANRWLRGLLKGVVVTSNVSGKNISLVNGDASLDDKVDKHDYFKVKKALLCGPGDARWVADADLNGDSYIDLKDCRIAMKNYGQWGDGAGGFWVTWGTLRPIILAPGAMTRLNPIATELGGFLSQVTGVAVPQILSSYDTSNGIILGTAADFPQKAAKENIQELGPDGFAICSEMDRTWILANTDLGVQNGVYAFLEDNDIGCRWYFPHPAWTIIPSKSSLYVSASQRTKPSYDYRHFGIEGGYWNTPGFEPYLLAWMKHNRLDGSFVVADGHSYYEYVSKSLWATHPEYFAYRWTVGNPPELVDARVNPDDPRLGGTWQPCTSNWDVLYLLENGVKAKLDVSGTNMASIEQNDGGAGQMCECAYCQAQGGYSFNDRPFAVANTVADEISVTHPGRWVGLLSYSDHSNPPNFNLRSNMYVGVCTEYNFSTPAQTMQQRIQGFASKGAKVGVYDYPTMSWWDKGYPGDNPMQVHASQFHLYATNLKNYKTWGATSYEAQMGLSWGAAGLGLWVASKLFWDTTQSENTPASDFYNNAFRLAASKMGTMYERWATAGTMTASGVGQSCKDLYDAYGLESSSQVRPRFDQLAMYMHWMRLHFDYDASVSRGDPPATIQEYAHQAIKYTQRIEDAWVIQSFVFLCSDPGYLLNVRYSAAKATYGSDAAWYAAVNGWKAEGVSAGIPSSSEAYNTLVADKTYYGY